MSRVAVVIATRDRRESLLHTLERLAALRERPEVVVVDNGSRDGTPGAVRGRPGVRLLEAGRDLGAAARTAGARLAEAEYVAFSDDDSWWAPGALHRTAACFDRNPRLGLLAARILVEPGGRLDPTCRAMAESPLPPDPGLPGPPVLGFVACGSVVRRRAFLDCGGFHPRLGFGGEEQLLALDLAAAGWGLAYVGDVVAHHRPSPAHDRSGRREALLRNEIWVAWLRRPPRRALRATARALREAGGAAPAVLAAAARGAPWVLGRRRPLPPRVERARRLLEA